MNYCLHKLQLFDHLHNYYETLNQYNKKINKTRKGVLEKHYLVVSSSKSISHKNMRCGS